MFRTLRIPATLLLFVLLTATSAPAQQHLELKRGDSICLVGGTLPERMQHDAWFETLLHDRFPEHQLRVRNLAFAADELTVRQRSDGFGSPDEHLALQKADVVLAFFGFNESFAGEAGLAKFKKDLEDYVNHLRGQKYNGQSAPKIVLFTPIAHENTKNRVLPDGSANNPRLKLYSEAMAEVAREQGVMLVDLFAASQQQYAAAARPLTINGVHLGSEGNQRMAAAMDELLFGKRAAAIDWAKLEKLRQAILDKNFHWFHRYRTTDGYSSYGGRSHLKFVDGQTNREVMMRELEILDRMAESRDQRIWIVAQGGDVSVNDNNTPPFLEVKTNKPGPGPNGQHVFLDGEEAIGKMTIGKQLQVTLFACERSFPELINPVQMAFDPAGRLVVAVWPTYPHWKPKDEMNDQLLMLEDTNGDGRADKCTVFADRLHNPTGFEFWNGGVLVAMAPDLLFLKDTDGDGKADVRERVLHGIDSADTHHTANSFVIDPGGALYFGEGVFHRTQIETPFGPIRNRDACIWRFEPRTWRVQRHIPYGFANPHGHVFDRWGQNIVHDGTGAQPYHGTVFSGHLNGHDKHGNPGQVYQQRTRPCAATEFLSSRHFPEEFQGNLLVLNVIGFQGILRYKIEDSESTLMGTEQEPILSSSDPHFRPSDIEIGPDGAIWFVDWHNPIIGHMQHNLRDPSRDNKHGRIYRVTYQGRPLSKPEPVAGQPIERLLDLLKHPEDRVCYRARLALGAHDAQQVTAAAAAWVARLDAQDPDHEHHLLEALWLHQQHYVVNEPLLKRVLASPDFRARAAATRVAGAWREMLPNSLSLLVASAGDEHPRVRLEAVRAASFYDVPEAIEVVIVAQTRPLDRALSYTVGQTQRVLDPIWKQAVSQGREIAVSSEAGARFFLRNITLEQLLARPRSHAVYVEMLHRPGLTDELRREALTGIAREKQVGELAVLLDAIRGIDGQTDRAGDAVIFDLVRLLTARPTRELAQVRAPIEALAVAGRQPVTRQVALVALMNIDGSVEGAWRVASRTAASLGDLAEAVPLVTDPQLQAALRPKIEPLLHGLPDHLGPAASSKGTIGRYVRVELPRRGTLTLAEVEVYSDGRNVARSGKATQLNTSHGGDAQRGIDGNTSGSYSANGQTHTNEDTDAPWWEVDLGQEYPIDSIVIYNRTDGELGQRLNGFTLRVLDGGRNDVMRRAGIAAPAAKASIDLEGGGLHAAVRRSAMLAMTSLRGQEAETFRTLAGFVREQVDPLSAVRAMQRIPRRFWPKDEADPLFEAIVRRVRATPVAQRTSQATLDLLEMADALTALLPADRAPQARRELGELGVRVIRVGTLPERMAYDKEVIVVEAGRPVEIVLENFDLMPHNLVILQPGALEEVGELAEATAQQPDAIERQYVPRSNKILLASNMLTARQSQKLSFQAPTQPGVYPYVCTYPGHWRRMYGALYVVANLDEYLADPEQYLAKANLPIRDDLLKDRRPRTEWKLEDLEEAVAGLNGRSFATGRQMFQVANCAACHQMNGVGTEIGPDLAKLDPKQQPLDVLKKLIEPSAKINEKFQSWTLRTVDGQIVTGLIVEENDQVVKVLENPLAKSEPTVLAKDEIDERQKSTISLMPKGLLDTLTRDEILDLIAYIAAEGSEKHRLFPAGGNGHGAGHGGHGH